MRRGVGCWFAGLAVLWPMVALAPNFHGSESADATHLVVKPSDPKLKGEESKMRLSANLAEPAFLELGLRFEFRQVASPTSTFGAAR